VKNQLFASFVVALSVRLWGAVCLTVLGVVLVFHSSQPDLPRLLYAHSQSGSLHLLEVGCRDLLSCPRMDREVVQAMYSLPVAQWSPDGKFVAVHLNSGWVMITVGCLLGNTTCEPEPILGAGDVRLAWGPDGSVLAVYNQGDAHLAVLTRGCWDPQDGDCLRSIIRLPERFLIAQPDWSADGRWLVFNEITTDRLSLIDTTCFDAPLQCVDEVNLASGAPGLMWPLASQDGTRVLFSAYTDSSFLYSNLFLHDQRTNVTTRLRHSPVNVIQSMDWSADERYIVLSGLADSDMRGTSLYLLDIEREIIVRLKRGAQGHLVYPNWEIQP
jgi:WD40 repeat protein